MQNLLLVQISDIHVKDASSVGLMRLERIAGAIGSLRDEADHVFVLLTGDIAHGGKSSQYDLVKASFEAMANRLRDEWKFESVQFFACPGNHDCDFAMQKPVVREAILSSVSAEGDHQLDLVKELAEVQGAFEEFRAVISPGGAGASEIVRADEVSTGGRKLNFLSVNTSWSSRIEEEPGSLRMPAQVLPAVSISEDLTIALLHHPLNWYDPQDGKALSDWLDANVDIAMWGHEHREDSFRVLRRRYGSSVQHYLARPIEDDSVECGFRALSLRADETLLELTFRWKTDRFELEKTDSSPLRRNPARQLGKIRFTKVFKVFLSDSGGSFKHPRLERPLMLQDIFIEPSFRSYSASPSDTERLDGTLSLDAMTAALEACPSAIVFGSEQSGKTTFAKYLIEDARHHGVTPLYFDGAKLRSMNKGEVTAWVKAAVELQYEDDCTDLVNQMSPTEKFVVVDNVHEIPGSPSAVRKILERINVLGSRVVYLSAQNPAVTILAASHSSGDEVKMWSEAKWFELLPLNNRTRGNLIRRWVATGRDESSDVDLIESEVRRIKALFDSSFGRGLSIKFPFFLLALLQQMDAGVDAKTIVRNGSHGHIFEAMVTAALEASVKSHDIGTVHEFLAAFAFELWSNEGTYISESGFEGLISDFRRDRFVQLSQPTLMNELVASKVLMSSCTGLAFRYSYFYYYYLARWISQKAGSDGSDKLLSGFVENIHTEMAANVVTFVAHLGHEKWVLGLLVPAAKELFSGERECKLAEHALLAGRYSEVGRHVVLLSGEASEVSDHHHDQEDVVTPEKMQESLEDAFKYMTAIRIMQVLGQVMRSRAGSIAAADKSLITRTSISLARRLMSVMYDAAELSAEILIDNASELFDSEIKRDSKEARGFASQLVAAVVGGIAKGVVSRAAEVFGTKDFVPLIDALEQEARASHDVDNELIVLCARVVAEQRYPQERIEALLRKLPGNDVLSKGALAHSVARTFYLQPPPHAVRDAACARLGIQIRKVPARPPQGNHLAPWRQS